MIRSRILVWQGTANHLIERLGNIGYKNAQIREAIRDVGGVIVAKTAAAYLARLPEEEHARIRSLSEEGLHAFLAEHQDLAPMPQEEFEKIHDETWEDYFKSVG